MADSKPATPRPPSKPAPKPPLPNAPSKVPHKPSGTKRGNNPPKGK
jgi:hypothetical protein